MSLRLTKAGNPSKPIKLLTELSLMGVLMFASQVAMSPLPNINLITILIILSVSVYGAGAFYCVFIFILLEGLLYGFGLWFFGYLYVWPIITIICLIFKRNQSRWFWAAVAGIWGMIFGFLFSIPYLFIGGPAMALSYWVSGIPFDIMHCVSNFVLTLLLLDPLRKLLFKLNGSV